MTDSATAAFIRDTDQLLKASKDASTRRVIVRQLLDGVQQKQQQHQQLRKDSSSSWRAMSWLLANGWYLLLTATVLIQAYSVSRGYAPTPQAYVAKMASRPCLYRAWMFLLETSRHPSDCQATCGGLTHEVEVEYYHNLTKERFDRVYARPSRPVIVRNATFDWPAMNRFNLSFFRDVYNKYPMSYAPHHIRNKLLPFRLPDRIRRLKQALHMTEAEQAGPWYLGWSNVDLNVHWELQKYYKIPNFLPNTTEYGQIEWFFMGTSQEAAYLHVDHTVKPAWQAQIRGRKEWELHPPAECMFQCVTPIKAHLQDGDIFVVDPSVWYHGTFVYPGEMSITFAMEFV